MAPVNAEPLEKYLHHLWDHFGSDVVLTAGSPPRYRIDGDLWSDTEEPFRPEQLEELVFAVLNEDLGARFKVSRDIDFAFGWRGLARFRANAFYQRNSVALAIRAIPYAIPSFEQLGLPQVTNSIVKRPHGLVLVTGPTGGGKSTTLASMLDSINDQRACHVLTLEDPIEYVHHHKKALVNQREVGEDTPTFATGLRAALREDPDVLLIGEMRDLETIRAALTIAETGHLVFATLHTNDTAQALDRIVDVFPAGQQQQIKVQLANSLQAIIYQQLLPRIGGGRVAAFEVLIANHAIRNLIKEGQSSQIRNVVVTSQKDGMLTFESSLSELIAARLVDYEVAVLRSAHPGEIRPLAQPPLVGAGVSGMLGAPLAGSGAAPVPTPTRDGKGPRHR